MRPLPNHSKSSFFNTNPSVYSGPNSGIIKQMGFDGIINIKLLQLNDMSLPEEKNETDFDRMVAKFKGLRTGWRIQGTMVNTGFNSKNQPVTVIGRLKAITIDPKQQVIRVFVTDPTTNKIAELYANSIAVMSESHVKTFDQFLLQD